jgi:hypothetical protein
VEIVASRELTGRPVDIECSADGNILLLILTVQEGEGLLQAFNPGLEEIWTRPINGGALLKGRDETNWVLTPAGATAFDHEGDRFTHVTASVPQRMQLSAFATLDDGFLFVCQHKLETPMCAPTISRVSSNGKACWSTTLPIGFISHSGVVQMSKKEGCRLRPIEPWIPETWRATSSLLAVSDDAVLACFSEIPRSGIGVGYVLSLSDGELRFVTQHGPISEMAALGGGAFLVGFQRYGAFETLRYGREGQIEGSAPRRGSPPTPKALGLA